MRVRGDDLRNRQRNLRGFSKRCGFLFLSAATAATAGLFLFRFAAATVTFVLSCRSFVRRRLFVWNIDQLIDNYFPQLLLLLARFCQALNRRRRRSVKKTENAAIPSTHCSISFDDCRLQPSI